MGDIHIENLVVGPRASGERDVTLESAKSKRLFYTKNTLPRVVIFSSFKICSISWKQFFVLVDFEKIEIRDFFTYQRIISAG